jgi:hypothetical protein
MTGGDFFAPPGETGPYSLAPMQLSLPFTHGYPGMEGLPPLPAEVTLPPETLFEEPELIIEALPPDPAGLAAERRQIVGTWQGGRRYVARRGRLASVWFHFAADGSAGLSVRYEGERRSTVTPGPRGRWAITCAGLTVTLGECTIQGPFSFHDGVMRWAGEALVLIPPHATTATLCVLTNEAD